MTAAARGARHGAVTVAARDAMTTAGPVPAGRRPGRGRRRLRDRRRGPLRGGRAACSSGCSAAAASWSPWSPARTPATSPQACEALGRARPPRGRRRGLRGRPGPLPAAGGGGVAVAGVEVGWDSPVAAVGGKHAKKIVEATGVETVGDLLGHLPAPLRAQGVAQRARGAQRGRHPLPGRRGGLARSRRPTRTGAPTARRTASRSGSRAEDGSLLLTYFDKHKSTADWRATKELPAGQRRGVQRPAEVVQQPVAADQPRLADVRRRR